MANSSYHVFRCCLGRCKNDQGKFRQEIWIVVALCCRWRLWIWYHPRVEESHVFIFRWVHCNHVMEMFLRLYINHTSQVIHEQSHDLKRTTNSVLTHERPMFLSCKRNQLFYLLCKSIAWFLYCGNICR